MTSSRSTGLFLVGMAIILLLVPACASKQDVSSLQGQVSYHQQQQARENQELKKKIVTLESELVKARQDIKQEISQSSQPVRSKQADLWAEIEQLRVQLATVRGEVDGLTRKMQILASNQDNATSALTHMNATTSRMNRVVTAMAGQLGMDLAEFHQESAQPRPSQAVQGVRPKQTSQPEAAPGYESAQALYKKALNSFYAKDYAQALSLWEEFATTFTKDSLVPNALFWQGECHYQMRDYARAILAYQKVIETYPKSNKYRPALLKQGISFFKMNKKKPGKLVLQDLIKKYPQSAEARRAKAYLQTNG
ncbi:tol-pal system protein YbgF [Desulfoplanes formicivorans]|uniref:Tol-pal system protein YbgF n=1 Tax=Desulfoplanes formicivorans TaxID=1592317 RepID=A0A194ACI2_9BACT|nr:tol-pal system protein YbgF [Desulfoplanes formicivorans]GAU07842.1 tol-pal system protein YbgF [Desulfoplanes formicivorans]